MTFADLLDEARVPYARAGRYTRPGWLQLRCPFCHGGRDPSKLYLGYNLRGNYANCWRCGKHAPTAVLAALTGRSHADCRQACQTLERTGVKPTGHEGHYKPPAGILPLTDPHTLPHRNYLAGRGFDWPVIAQLWRVGAIRIAPRLPWRLFIPIERHGVAVSWTTRRLGDKEPRYVSARLDEEAWPHKTLLYGEDYVRHAVIVHEGPLDAWATGPGAVALLGTGFTAAQIRRLARYPVRAVCFDNEPAGQQRAHALIDALCPFEGDTYNIVLDSKDAAAATPAERARLRRAILGATA